MKSLSGLAGKKLIILRPSIWKSYYQLKHGEEILGSMPPISFSSSHEAADIFSEHLEFYRAGFRRSEITILSASGG